MYGSNALEDSEDIATNKTADSLSAMEPL